MQTPVLAPGDDGAGVPWQARAVTYGLAGLLVLCVVAQLELWPLSAFRLFSTERTSATTSWDVRLVAADGTEHVLPFDRLPRGYRGVHHVAPRLRDLPAEDRDGVCRAWAGAAATRLGVVATGVRVYKVSGHVGTGASPAPPARRMLWVTCAGAGT
ncbi:MAG TPA: hypothetical protein VHM89_04575 [Acidimicrobiales bacterium]|nr:hypothetical protein [Acidimicrobiales bacterium]